MSQPIPLRINNLVKDYGTLRALNGVSFSVNPGEVFGLLGPNGAGKTSLISIVVSLENLSGGQVEVFGRDLHEAVREVKRKIGWVPQEVINHGFFTVDEILVFQAGYYGLMPKQAKSRIEFLLESLGLLDHRHKKVRQLSGGMKRRLMIAKALVHSPGLLLLDEPTAGVDVELRLKLWSFVEELRRQGLSILLTTHYLEEAERLCDRVAIIHKGSIQAIDQTKKLIERYSRKKITLRLTHGMAGIKHPDLLSGDDKEWIFVTAMGKGLGQLLGEIHVNSEQINDVTVQEGSLEDVFVHFTQGAQL